MVKYTKALGCTHVTIHARHATNFCGWICEHTFAYLEVCNLKIHMSETYFFDLRNNLDESHRHLIDIKLRKEISKGIYCMIGSHT